MTSSAPTVAERLAALAAVSAIVASLAGFVPGLYRDPAIVVAQSHGYDVGNIVAASVLLLALVGVHRWPRGGLVVLGALGCLLYSYVTYAFLIVLNPATVLYIAVLGFGGWSIVAGLGRDGRLRDEQLHDERSDAERPDTHAPRRWARVAGGYLLVLAVLFAFNWLRQIAGSVVSGQLPAELQSAGWPMNPIFVLDLGFVLPLMALSGGRLLRNRAAEERTAIPVLVFQVLLAVTILSMAASQAMAGQAIDGALVAIFVLVAVASGLLAGVALGRPSPGIGTTKRVAQPAG